MKLEFHHINYASEEVEALNDFYLNILKMDPIPPQNFIRTTATQNSGYDGKIMFATKKEIVGSVQNNVLQKLKETIELRHEFLTQKGLEKDHQLQTDKERRDFLRFAKSKYHAQSEQREWQKLDKEEVGILKMHKRKH